MRVALVILFAFTCGTIIGQNNPEPPLNIAKYKARFIPDNAKYLIVGRGFSNVNTKKVSENEFVSDGNVQIRNSNSFSLFYEHGIRNHCFVELGYNTYFTGITSGFSNGSKNYNGLTRNHQVQLGLGYRLITNKNVHLVNFHAGTFFGLLQQRFSDTFALIDPSTGVLYLNRTTNRFNYGIYAGLTKDIRLSSDVRFFINYTQQIGVRDVFKGSFYINSTNAEFNQDG